MSYSIRENRLQSQEGLIGLSLFEDETETDFYTLEFVGSEPAVGNAILTLAIFGDSNYQFYNRSIYTFFDMLGDIGGLFDALCYLSTMISFSVSMCTVSGQDRFIVSNIFQRESKKDPSPHHRVTRRKPLVSRVCSLMWHMDHKRHRMFVRAAKSYQKELDILHFIKLQKVTQSLQKMLYTKAERYLLRNNKCFLVNGRKNYKSDSDSVSDKTFKEQNWDRSKHY